MKNLNREDELFESLITEKISVPAMSPPFRGYGPWPQQWNYRGGPYQVHPRHNPKDHCDIEYRNTEGKRHRIYGPAYKSIIYNIEAWYKDGERHRVDGPALVHNNNMVWFYEGKLHRLDGPAVVESGGPKQYWIMGQRLSPKEYKKEIARRKRKGLIRE
jgi:hypothetical protein